MKQEIERTRSAVECIGASAVRILLGPYFAHETGEALNESDAADDDHAATKLELAGACWVLPDFYGKLEDVELISTFKKHLVRQLSPTWRQTPCATYSPPPCPTPPMPPPAISSSATAPSCAPCLATCCACGALA